MRQGMGQESAPATPRYSVLDVPVDALQISDVVQRIRGWIAGPDRTRFVAVTGMHGVMEAQDDRAFLEVLQDADLVVADGYPLVVLGRARGHEMPRRVYGPELMKTFLRETGGSFRHYFYGGPEGLAERLAGVTERRFGTRCVGTFSPPFRPVDDTELREICARINDAAPDVVWVGLSTPKQERWAHRAREHLEAPAVLCVGAAFDFLAGTKKSAPRWIGDNGLEWAYRLASEPRRLWRRYLINGPRFLFLLAKRALGRGREHLG